MEVFQDAEEITALLYVKLGHGDIKEARHIHYKRGTLLVEKCCSKLFLLRELDN